MLVFIYSMDSLSIVKNGVIYIITITNWGCPDQDRRRYLCRCITFLLWRFSSDGFPARSLDLRGLGHETPISNSLIGGPMRKSRAVLLEHTYNATPWQHVWCATHRTCRPRKETSRPIAHASDRLSKRSRLNLNYIAHAVVHSPP